MQKPRRLMSITLAFAMLAAIAVPSGFAEHTPSISERLSLGGYIPSKLELVQESSNTPFVITRASSIPDKYDPRNENSADHTLTPVKDQGLSGLCWDFSAIAAVESYINKTRNQVVDLSEVHMAYATSEEGGNTFGFSRPVNGGGGTVYAVPYLMRGTLGGVVLEENDDSLGFSPLPVRPVSETASKPIAYKVTGVTYIPDMPQDPTASDKTLYMNRLKQAIMSSGAVSSGVWLGSEGFSLDDKSYNDSGTDRLGAHSITIVGWNDNFPAESFKYTPTQDGAFLVKNSWGTYSHDGGYFWLSYDSLYLSESFYITGVATPDTYDGIFEYDLGNWAYSSFPSNTMCLSNIFSCEDDNASLTEVSFFTANENVSYSLYCGIASDITDQALLQAALDSPLLASGTFALPGYHTVRLSTPLDISNQQFAVMLKLQSTDKVKFSVEMNESPPGQSYYSMDDGETWLDFHKSFCIKAIVKGSKGGANLPRTGVTEPEPEPKPDTDNTLIIKASSSETDAAECLLDLENEMLLPPDGYVIGAYSLNGGTSWKTGSGIIGDIGKFLDKGGTLWLAEGYDRNNKIPTGTVYKFPVISKRPATVKLTPNYLAAHLNDGVVEFGESAQNKWVLTAPRTDSVVNDNILICETSNGKTPDGNWYAMPGDGIAVRDLPSDGKVKKTVYYYRTQATVNGSLITPASKPVKLSVSSLQKPKALKIDYKKETLKGYAGMGASFMDDIMSKETARTAIDINACSPTSLIDAGGFTYWTAPTRTKPASPVVTYKTLARAALNTETPGVSNGKLALDKKYEVYNGNKWGRLPRISGASDEGISIRVKATGKALRKAAFTAGKWAVTDVTGLAASKPGTLSYIWGVYTSPDARTAKSGVLSASIVPES